MASTKRIQRFLIALSFNPQDRVWLRGLVCDRGAHGANQTQIAAAAMPWVMHELDFRVGRLAILLTADRMAALCCHTSLPSLTESRYVHSWMP